MIPLLQSLLSYLKEHNRAFAYLLTPLIVLITIAVGLVSSIHYALDRFLGFLDNLLPSVQWPFGDPDLGVFSGFYISINTFIPLDVIFELCAFFLVLHGIAALIRIVKSFVPTVA